MRRATTSRLRHKAPTPNLTCLHCTKKSFVTRQHGSLWIEAVDAYVASRQYSNFRKAPGIDSLFQGAPSTYFHDEGIFMFLLHHYLFDGNQRSPNNGLLKWEVAIRLITARVGVRGSSNDYFRQGLLPTAYLVFRMFHAQNIRLKGLCGTAAASPPTDVYSLTRDLPHPHEISTRVLYKLFHQVILPLDAESHSMNVFPRYEFLPDAFYNAMSPHPRKKTKVFPIDKEFFLSVLHELILSQYVAAHDEHALTNAVLLAFSTRSIRKALRVAPRGSHHVGYLTQIFPKMFPQAVHMAQMSDFSLRYMRYIITLLFAQEKDPTNHSGPLNVSSLIPPTLVALHGTTDDSAARFPAMILSEEDPNRPVDHIPHAFSPALGDLIRVYESTVRKYYAFHEANPNGHAIAQRFDWDPLRSVTLRIFQLLLRFYHIETSSGEETNTLRGTWKLATNFLSNLSAMHTSTREATRHDEHPLLHTSMYFSLCALMYSHERSTSAGGAQAIVLNGGVIVRRNVVGHMHEMLLRRSADGTGQISALRDVYMNVREVIGGDAENGSRRAGEIAMLFIIIVLCKFRYRAIDLWAKSMYAFAGLEAAKEWAEKRRALCGATTLCSSAASKALYSLAYSKLRNYSAQAIFFGELFRQLCANNIQLNTNPCGDQSPAGFFWTKSTFKHMFGYLLKVYLWEKPPTHSVSDDNTLAPRSVGLPSFGGFQALWLQRRYRFLFSFQSTHLAEDGALAGKNSGGRNSTPKWMDALISLQNFSNITGPADSLLTILQSQMIRLSILLLLSKMGLAADTVHNILIALKRQMALRDVTRIAKPRFGLTDFFATSKVRIFSDFHEDPKASASLQEHQAVTPLVLFCMITSNFVLVVQELLRGIVHIDWWYQLPEGVEIMAYLVSRQFWLEIGSRQLRRPGSLMLVVNILLSILRSFPTNEAKSRYSCHRVQSREGSRFCKQYLLRFAESFVGVIASRAGIALHSAQDVLTHMRRVSGGLSGNTISQTTYMDMKSVDFSHSFVLIDTGNILQPMNLKIFIEGIRQKNRSMAGDRVTVIIPCTFLIEYLFVSQHRYKALLREKRFSLHELFTFVLEPVKDLVKLPSAHVMVLSPGAELSLRAPMEEVRLSTSPINDDQFAENVLYRYETDHVLTAVGVGLHRHLEDMRGVRDSLVGCSTRSMSYSDRSEVLVVSEDKLNANIALSNGLRSAVMYYSA